MITSINEFKLNESSSTKVVARDKEHLKQLIDANIKHFGNECDLNYIDVGNITTMQFLFNKSSFNGNISEWNVGNVKTMEGMFFGSQFNGDISNWDVSNVTIMHQMFQKSQFNQDISKWEIHNVEDMQYMFKESAFNQNINNWNADMGKVFVYEMFEESELEKNNNLPEWYY